MQQILKQVAMKDLMAADAWSWAHFGQLVLQGSEYKLLGHEYQVDCLQEIYSDECYIKGAQMGITETMVIRTLHGMIHRAYPVGALYLFPSANDVTDFSKARFKSLIEDNPELIGQHVRNTDAANIKQIGGAMLYLRGARSTKKIDGQKRSSTGLKSVPVDLIVFDEYDEMEPDMIRLALERVSHSKRQHTWKLSTPSIPDYGIDAEYNKSDMRVWMISCTHCGKETCLDLEFPNCIEVDKDGIGHRTCKHCRREIYPHDGRWVAREKSDYVGRWISQLNSIYINPARILDEYYHPPNGDLSEVMNSKLGRAYIAAENRLTRQDVYACCGMEPMAESTKEATAFGMDVGKVLHVVIGTATSAKAQTGRVLKVARVDSFQDVYDLVRQYNCKAGVIDMEPEVRQAREFRKALAGRCKIWLCDYAENQRVSEVKREDEGVVVVRRTETLDASHEMISRQKVVLPRRCPEMEEFAAEMINTAKTLREDQESGARKYVYVKLGADHYRHAFSYWQMALRDPMISVAAAYETPVTPADEERAWETTGVMTDHKDPWGDDW